MENSACCRRAPRQNWIKAATLSATAIAALTALPAFAAQASLTPAEVEALRQELREMRQQQLAAAARIDQLQTMLNNVDVQPAPMTATISRNQAPPPLVTNAASQTSAPASKASRLNISGDLRLRYEGNFSDASVARNRGVIRARIRADYQINDWLEIGGRIGTGNADDPNSDDVSLSDFADDLSVSLDQVYASFSHGGAVVRGGKIPLPFKRTDLVWDGDVNPQGASISYTTDFGGAKINMAGLYFIIDEDVAGPDSDMLGGQIGFQTSPGADFSVQAAVAYYDYSLASLGGADAGDFRSNLLALDGSYLSDFNLLDVNGGFTYAGFGDRWPVSLSGDYVKNFGSATNEDTGYSVDVSAGRAKYACDWRLAYGYMNAEVDAVFAAFSHDNLEIATSYELHSLSADYVIDSHFMLNATYYRYHALEGVSSATFPSDQWLNRLRLNAVVTF